MNQTSADRRIRRRPRPGPTPCHAVEMDRYAPAVEHHKDVEQSYSAALAINDLRPVTDDDTAALKQWRIEWDAAGASGLRSLRPPPIATVVHDDQTWVHGPEHAWTGGGTVCGLADEEVIVVRHFFSTTKQAANCRKCQAMLKPLD